MGPWQLRLRETSPELVADVIDEVEALGLDDDELEAELGDVEEYAKRLVPIDPPKRVTPAVRTSLVLSGLWLLFVIVAAHGFDWNAREELGRVFTPAWVMMAVAFVVDFVYARRASHVDRNRRPAPR